jgi:ERCC4-type nuclease
MSPEEPLPTPFTVLIDTREQHPYRFEGLRSDAREGRRPLAVQTERATLRSGDYSLCAWCDYVAVERKSVSDLFGTLGQGRERFERELLRLAEMEFAAVVVEANWSEVLAPQPHSQLNPKTVHRSVIAWQQRHPRVHWWFCGDRWLAEVTTFRILERWWRDHATA